MSFMTGRKGYNAELDIFRFLFAMMIAWFHLTHFTGIGLVLPEIQLPLIRLIGGYMATDFFFLVSGAMMARHAQKLAGTPMRASEPLRYCLDKYKKTLVLFLTSLAASLLLGKLMGAGLLWRSKNPLDAIWEALGLHMSGAGSGYLISDPDWYLSALLLGCILVYPVCRRHPDFAMEWLAPVGSVFIFGYLVKTYGHLCVNFGDFRLVYPAVLRAAAGLLLGCCVWRVAQRLAAVRLTALGHWCVTAAEIVCFAGVWALSTVISFTRNDMVSLLLLAGLCVLVLSGQSGLGAHLREKPARFLGDMSRSVFFSHYIVFQYFQRNPLSTPNRTFAVFTLCVLAMAAAVLAVSKLLAKLFRRAAPRLRKWIVVDGAED